MFKKLDITNINGDIIVSENFETEIDGLYAIGDCAKKDVYQLVTAASDGCIAVSDIEKLEIRRVKKWKLEQDLLHLQLVICI